MDAVAKELDSKLFHQIKVARAFKTQNSLGDSTLKGSKSKLGTILLKDYTNEKITIDLIGHKFKLIFQKRDITSKARKRRKAILNISKNTGSIKHQMKWVPNWFQISENQHSGWYELFLTKASIDEGKVVARKSKFMATFVTTEKADEMGSKHVSAGRCLLFNNKNEDNRAFRRSRICSSWASNQIPKRNFLKIEIIFYNKAYLKEIGFRTIYEALLEVLLSLDSLSPYIHTMAPIIGTSFKKISYFGINVCQQSCFKFLPFEAIPIIKIQPQKVKRKATPKKGSRPKLKSSDQKVHAIRLYGFNQAVKVDEHLEDSVKQVDRAVLKKIRKTMVQDANVATEAQIRKILDVRRIDEARGETPKPSKHLSVPGERQNVYIYFAQVIQTWARRCFFRRIVRNRFRTNYAALQIHRVFMGFRTRKWVKPYKTKMFHAANGIQMIFHMTLFANFLNRRELAAKRIQKFSRHMLIFLRISFIMKHNQKAIIVQKIYRGNVARKQFEILKVQWHYDNIIVPSACLIQRNWRMRRIARKIGRIQEGFNFIHIWIPRIRSLQRLFRFKQFVKSETKRFANMIAMKLSRVIIRNSKNYVIQCARQHFQFQIKCGVKILLCFRRYRRRVAEKHRKAIIKIIFGNERFNLRSAFQHLKQLLHFLPRLQRFFRNKCCYMRILSLLELLNFNKFEKCALRIQTNFRAWRARNRFERISSEYHTQIVLASIKIQRFLRKTYSNSIRKNKFISKRLQMFSEAIKFTFAQLEEINQDKQITSNLILKLENMLENRKIRIQSVKKSIKADFDRMPDALQEATEMKSKFQKFMADEDEDRDVNKAEMKSVEQWHLYYKDEATYLKHRVALGDQDVESTGFEKFNTNEELLNLSIDLEELCLEETLAVHRLHEIRLKHLLQSLKNEENAKNLERKQLIYKQKLRWNVKSVRRNVIARKGRKKKLKLIWPLF